MDSVKTGTVVPIVLSLTGDAPGVGGRSVVGHCGESGVVENPLVNDLPEYT